MYLIDTNVISEVTKKAPDASVLTFLSTEADLWVPSMALHEMAFGIRRLSGGPKRTRLERAIALFTAEFDDRIVPLHREAAEHAAEFRAQAEHRKFELSLSDALIAGTAAAHGLILATRNVKDFERLDLDILNPWLSDRSMA